MTALFLLSALIAPVASLRMDSEECDTASDLASPPVPAGGSAQTALNEWAAAGAASDFQACIDALLGMGRRKDTPAVEAILKDCPDTGKLFGALVKGVQDAGFMKSSAWDTDGVLKVELTSPQLYGEIASASKVPIMWKLNGVVQIAVTPGEHPWQTIVAVSGVEMMYSAEGSEIYAQATEGIRCTDEELAAITLAREAGSVDMKKTCIQREITAVGKFLPGWYKSIKSGNKDAERKISRIMRDMYGTTATYTAVSMGGPRMSSEWPKVFYSLITPQPGKLIRFTFNDEAAINSLPKKEKTEVLKAHKPGVKVHEMHPEDFHDVFKLQGKTDLVGYKSLGDAQKTLPIAEKAARSGMAFAEMIMWGKFESLLLTTGFPHMGPIGALMNMFSLCDEGDSNLAETRDPSCKGSTIGRVSWASKPSHRFV